MKRFVQVFHHITKSICNQMMKCNATTHCIPLHYKLHKE